MTSFGHPGLERLHLQAQRRAGKGGVASEEMFRGPRGARVANLARYTGQNRRVSLKEPDDRGDGDKPTRDVQVLVLGC